MNDNLPKALLQAQEKGIEYFMGEDYEWKLEIENNAGFIEEIVGSPVLIFANNGYGDNLFLKKTPNGTEYSETIFEYLHDGPEIHPVNEVLETLLGLSNRPPSNDNYPKAIYETGEPVQLGDHVQIKVWAEFWKGWQTGIVEYVPGISNKNPQLEHGGLKWVAIRLQNGQICPLVDHESGKLKKVKFVRRSVQN